MAEISVESATAQAIEAIQSPELVSAVLKRGTGTEKITLRPVEIKGQRMVQVSAFDGRKTDVKNYIGEPLVVAVSELLMVPYRSVFVATLNEEVHIQVSKKGKPLVTRKRKQAAALPQLDHNRTIQRPLPEGTPDLFLQRIGLMTADGRIKADRQRKFQQINEFIRVACETAEFTALPNGPMLIVDFGCGNAYLTFGLHHYLNERLNIPCELIGVDRNADSVERDRAKAAELESDSIHFEVASIGDFIPPRQLDVVVALHACDTATDEALAQALRHESRFIFSSPCCHHHLQVQLAAVKPSGGHASLMRDGIIRERLGDLITDELRAMILRIAGYKVDIIEFTSLEHTARNLLIRARRVKREDVSDLVADYQALKRDFGVTPYLETISPPWVQALLS